MKYKANGEQMISWMQRFEDRKSWQYRNEEDRIANGE